MEIRWKNIKGYKGYYQVSRAGDVRSLPRHVKCKGGKRRLLRSRPKKCAITNGYHLALLSKNGKEKGIAVHRLVGLHFVPNPYNKPEINHKDGNKLNNNADNLEWCTRSENAQHAQDMGLQTAKRGEQSHFAKLTNEEAENIRQEHINGGSYGGGIGINELAEGYDVSESTIRRILKNQTYIGLIESGLAIDIRKQIKQTI